MRGIVSSVVTLAFLVSGCGKGKMRSEPGTTGGFVSYAATGIVHRVDAEARRVTIAHESIPGYMDAMTMPFKVREKGELSELKANDRVTFFLNVGSDESWISKIRPVGAMPPPQQKAEKPQEKDLVESGEERFTFTNELGRAVHLKDFAGRPLALTFFFTRCPVPNYCPRLSKNFQEASAILKRKADGTTDWQFLSVTIDPENDTPERMKTYGERYEYDSNHWSFLTGPKGRVENLARMFGLQFDQTNGLYNHGFRTVVINRSNKVQMIFPVTGNLSQTLADEMLKASEGGVPKP